MSDNLEGAESHQIDYDAAERLGGRWRWKEDLRAKAERKKYPFSKDPLPRARIEAQGIAIGMTADEIKTDKVAQYTKNPRFERDFPCQSN